MVAENAGRERPVAFVTGASRGIGRSAAVHLAAAGFDVAMTARTVREGEQREYSSTTRRSEVRSLPGSLASTADAVRAAGGEPLVIGADLLDRAATAAAATAVLERWGRIDVFVNNAQYVGPGNMDSLLATPISLLDAQMEANVVAPFILLQRILPAMVRQGRGLVINVTSSVGWRDPSQPPGEGGWGLGYGMSKAAVHRTIGVLAVEMRGQGVQFVNLGPGFVATERVTLTMGDLGIDASAGTSPDVPGAAIAWLASCADWETLNGTTVHARDICEEHGLAGSGATR